MNLGLGKAGVLGGMLIIGLGVGAQSLHAEPSAALPQSRVQACAPIVGGIEQVVAVPAPLVLELGSGERVRLIGLGVTPVAEQGVGHAFHLSALKQLVLGEKVQLRFNGPQQDRHGRTLAHVVVLGASTQVWLQAAMVAEGAALVDSWEAHAACTSTLLDLEKQARVEQKGLWASPQNIPVSGQDAEGITTGRFAIIEGTVLAAANVRGQIYLNFGDDWRTDFTIRLAPKTARRFLKENIDPLAFEGEVVRVRGFVSWRGGPEILVTHPEQIERVTSESLALRR